MEWLEFQSVGRVFRRNADLRNDETAFIFGGVSTSFGEVNRRTNRLSHSLAAAGVRPGDNVGMLSHNRVEFFDLIGLSKSGMVPVPLNWRFTSGELLAVLEDSRPKALLVEEEFVSIIEQLRPQLDFVELFIALEGPHDGWTSYAKLTEDAPDHEPEGWPDGEGVACIVYTSGTTGMPKGVMLGHQQLIVNAGLLVDEAGILKAGDVVLAVMPFFHVGGLWYYAFPAFALGCKTIILSNFDPELVLDAMAQHKVTSTHIVPTMLAALIEMPDAEIRANSLKRVFYAGSPIPPTVLRQALNTLNGCDFIQGFGSTEAAGISFLSVADHRLALSGAEHEKLLLSCGRPFSTTVVRVDTSSMDNLDASAVGAGELYVHSPNVMLGYWQKPELTHEIMADDLLRTGDIGRFDDQGYLYLIDRKNNMIVTGGENVFPFEVEQVLSEYPEVLEVAVFSIPDDHWVEKVVAAVVMRAGATATESALIAATRKHLASYKCPKAVIFLDTLPKSAVGKVQKNELKDMFSAYRSTFQTNLSSVEVP